MRSLLEIQFYNNQFTVQTRFIFIFDVSHQRAILMLEISAQAFEDKQISS